jgi:hypothetical protein
MLGRLGADFARRGELTDCGGETGRRWMGARSQSGSLPTRVSLVSTDQVCDDLHEPNLELVCHPGGSVVRYVDMPPGHVSPMHRTVSLDYGFVLFGKVEVRAKLVASLAASSPG